MVKKIYHIFYISTYLSYVMHYTYEITQKNLHNFVQVFISIISLFLSPMRIRNRNLSCLYSSGKMP
jgi:hypothetical protein